MKDLKKIVTHYGMEQQMDVAVEECSELIKALMKYKRKLPRRDADINVARKDIIDELADVSIMVEQMKYYFNCANEVENRIDYKIKRQIERMKNNE